jgi:hypothetical protein
MKGSEVNIAAIEKQKSKSPIMNLVYFFWINLRPVKTAPHKNERP